MFKCPAQLTPKRGTVGYLVKCFDQWPEGRVNALQLLRSIEKRYYCMMEAHSFFPFLLGILLHETMFYVQSVGKR